MPQQRFHTLDALRGIAAIGVMLFHTGDYMPFPIPGGYLAADLFFVLSGFVLTHAYQDRLANGLTLRAFAAARLVRLYPVFWLGALLGCILLDGSPLTMLMIPTMTPGGLLFDANWPLWSLLLELIVNIAWAAFLARLGTPLLIVALLLIGGLLIAPILTFGLERLGPFWVTLIPGLLRTSFSFLVGALLYRVWIKRNWPQREASAAWLLLPALLAILCFQPANRALFDMAMLTLVIPAIVWLGATHQIPAPRLAAWLGGLSFPLYCLHAPIVAFTQGPMPVVIAIYCGIVLLASLVDRYFDQPVQALIKAQRQPACPHPQAMI